MIPCGSVDRQAPTRLAWLPCCLLSTALVACLPGCFGAHSSTIQANGLSVQASQSRYHQQKGVKHFQRGELDAAGNAFEQAILANPNNGTAHNNLGLVRYEQHRLFQAATHFETASELRPNDPRPLNSLGMTLEAGGKGLEALDYYLLAHEMDPIHPLYLGNVVRTRIRLGENDESVLAQLKQLRFIEDRPEWIRWIDRQLALELNPYLDRGPAVELASNQQESLNGNSVDSVPGNDTYDPVLIDGSEGFDPDGGVMLAPPGGMPPSGQTSRDLP